MQGQRTIHDVVNGVVRYLKYDTEGSVDIQLDNPLNLQQDDNDYIRFKLLNGEIVYDYFGECGYDTQDHPLTEKQFVQVEAAAALVLNTDITFSVTDLAGSKISVGVSTITLQPGTYKIDMSAGFDFSSANGYAQIVAMDHDTHSALVFPALKSSVYVYAQNLPNHLGTN